jgi:hypothetical protein
MGKRRDASEQVTSLVWQQFQSVVDAQLLTAPKLDWDRVDRHLIYYLCTHVQGTPWINHLAFVAGISFCQNHLDRKTVKNYLQDLHRRFQCIFQRYGLADFSQWKPAEHLPRYMNDPSLPDTFETRYRFLQVYTASTRMMQVYLQSLPEEERALYQSWLMPPLPTGMRQRLGRATEVLATQALRRKADSDAVTPHFARIRGEAHVRWNELARLRQKFYEARAVVQTGKADLPLVFSYEEPRRKQRLHFLLWDRPSFVLAHAEHYTPKNVSAARSKRQAFVPERNHYFLEFTGAESMAEGNTPHDVDALLWFGDLLRYNLLSRLRGSGRQEEIQQQQIYLRSWGYGEDGTVFPFYTHHAGLLSRSQADGTMIFLDEAQKRTGGLLLSVEPLFAAATFGLAALDFFTTTGARITELLQLSLTPDCLYTLKIEGIQRLLVKLVPKGKDTPGEYMVGAETRKNFERVADLLKEHYSLQPGDTLPSVSFNLLNNRAHDFTEPRPYLFQYNQKHLSHQAITACLRFLCHGMVFQRADGTIAILNAHLLRHAFATHLHQVEHVPLDLVATILHQSDIRVTRYYAAPQWQQVVETTDTLLDRFATHLGSVEDAFVRAPAELQRQLADAKKQVGALTKVIGGQCTCYALCPISFACTGCVYKVPDPAHREEIVEQRQWAFVRLEQVKRQGLGPETLKMQALIQRCDTELEEMNLIEEYRADEHYQPELRIESGKAVGKSSASLAPKTLSTEA